MKGDVFYLMFYLFITGILHKVVLCNKLCHLDSVYLKIFACYHTHLVFRCKRSRKTLFTRKAGTRTERTPTRGFPVRKPLRPIVALFWFIITRLKTEGTQACFTITCCDFLFSILITYRFSFLISQSRINITNLILCEYTDMPMFRS